MDSGDVVQESVGISGQPHCTLRTGVSSLRSGSRRVALQAALRRSWDLDTLLGAGVVNVGITLTLCRHTAAGRYVLANDMEILNFARCKADPTGPLLLGCITGDTAVVWWVNTELGAEPVEFELTAVEARLVHRQYQEQQQDIAKWDAVEHRTIADENALDEALNRDVFAGTRFDRTVSQTVR